MKKLFLLLCLMLLSQYDVWGQSIFELSPSQSMSISGKGPGQDAAINPYLNSNSYGIIENIGMNDFTIRIQEKGKIIRMIVIKTKQIKKVNLLKGYELYLDSELKSKAKVEFEKMIK